MGDNAGLKTLADLQAAMTEVVGGKCERCHQAPATLTLRADLLPPRESGRGMPKPAARVKADVCEACGVQVLAVVGRAVGQVRA